MNKRIAIYGSTGMLGHIVYDHLRQLSGWEIYPITRTDILFDHSELLKVVKPEIIINCAGMVKQAINESRRNAAVAINTVVPFTLNSICKKNGVKYIHFSTDCVIANDTPDMTEDGHLTPSGIYRYSKAIGEPCDPNAITFRTSFIGREFHSNYGLLNWLLNHQPEDTIVGYRKALFSGTTNLEIAKIISHLISSGRYVDLEGLYNITGEPISKYDLLGKLNAAYHLRLNIVPDDSVIVDRTLDPSMFVEATGIEPKGWDQLIKEYQDYYSFVAS